MAIATTTLPASAFDTDLPTLDPHDLPDPAETHARLDRIRIRHRSLLGGLTAIGLVAAGMSSIPAASATCASFFGIGNSADCTSTLFSGAIAVGPGAQAYAEGAFGTALAIGEGSGAEVHNPFGLAATLGAHSTATTKGLFGIALNVGALGGAQTFGKGADYSGLGFNIALNVGGPKTGDGSSDNPGGYAEAYGVGNIASNLFGGDSTEVDANGVASTATNLGGSGSPSNPLSVYVGDVSGNGLFNNAFNVLGQGNYVYAGPGPFAVAGTILQTDATAIKEKPGFNINGLRVPNSAAAAVRGASGVKRSAAGILSAAPRGNPTKPKTKTKTNTPRTHTRST
jgi:hypothetical protein